MPWIEKQVISKLHPCIGIKSLWMDSKGGYLYVLGCPGNGWVLYRLGRNAEALVELRRAFTLQKDAEIAAHVAEVLWVMGQKDEARRYFEEARKLDPDNRSLLRALEKTGA